MTYPSPPLFIDHNSVTSPLLWVFLYLPFPSTGRIWEVGASFTALLTFILIKKTRGWTFTLNLPSFGCLAVSSFALYLQLSISIDCTWSYQFCPNLRWNLTATSLGFISTAFGSESNSEASSRPFKNISLKTLSRTSNPIHRLKVGDTWVQGYLDLTMLQQV